MIPPIRKTLRLSGGTVVLRAWGSHVIEAYTLDLLTITATLGVMRDDDWTKYRRPHVEQDTWDAFWRLVHASLDDCKLPRRITWQDRLDLLDTLFELNGLQETEGKVTALIAKAVTLLKRHQGHPTPTMSS